MALPAPHLDDRRFQDLVDDAKRLVQQRCPEWTDHNVHDPGVTLIEVFAWMTDQLLYRLNRVPDRLFVSFLELVGIELSPPTAARVDQTFWLSAAQDAILTVPGGTTVSTARNGAEEPLVFATTKDLMIVPCAVEQVRSALTDGAAHDHGEALAKRVPFTSFTPVPLPGDVLLVGLTAAVPRNAVVLRCDCRVEGVGVDPRDPPLVWEAWTGSGWTPCDLERDETGGLNRAGDVVLHVPADHTHSLIGGQRSAWLRARILESRGSQPSYSHSPTIHAIAAFTMGGTVEAANGELVTDELLGISEGVSGQVFPLLRRPVVQDGAAFLVDVSDTAGDEDGPTGWRAWSQVPDFSDSEYADQHIVLDAVAGEVRLGPAVREPDGRVRHYGAVPGKGAVLRVRSYRVGGGARGNVATGSLVVVKSSVPYVARTTNRRPAAGGRDAESIDAARVRGPLTLRSRGRAVTARDIEQIALDAARDVARVRAVPVLGEAAVRVLIVPTAAHVHGRLDFGQLVPDDDALRRVAEALEPRRVVGTRILVEPPTYQGITVVARLRAAPLVSAAQVQVLALEALYMRFSPLVGGPDESGWPFGRPVHVGEIYAVLARLPGVDLVEDARLFPADPVTGQRGEATQRIEIEPHALVFSYEHQVLVQEGS